MRFILMSVWLVHVTTFTSGQSGQVDFYELQSYMNSVYAGSKAKGGEYKMWKRMEHYMQTRLGDNGELVNTEARKWKVWSQFRKEQLTHDQREYSGNWEFFGPYIVEGNAGIGRINRIAFHPTDPDKIYVGSAGGGLFYTWTHGALWVPLTESLPVNNISGVAIDYTDPDIIYILTGDGDGSFGSARGYGLRKSSMGVLKTTDGGDTWQQTGLVFDETEEVWPFDLVMHPDFPNIMFAVTSTGVYRTLDSGDSWYPTLEGGFFEFHFKPDQPNIVFATGQSNLYRSTTLGLSWDTIPIPLYQDSIAGRFTMAFCQDDPDLIYLAAGPGDTVLFRGLFKSEDAGLTFDLMTNESGLAERQTNVDFSIACSPDDVNDVLVGAVSIYKSTDGGSTLSHSGGTHADIHDFQINPINDRIYVGTDGGLYYSDNFGDDWTFMSEICAITQYYKIAVSQQEANVVIGGTQDNGTNRNLSGATTVFDKIGGKDGMDCAIHPLKDSLMIYSAQNGEFWISNDRGETGDSLVNVTSLPETVGDAWVTPIAWDPADTNVIFVGYDPIYRSFDRGATFNPIPDTISGRRFLHVTAGAERIYAGDTYVVGDENEFQVWKSTDQGDSWSPIHTGEGFPLPSRVISGLCTRPDDPDEIWVCVGGWIDQVKVFRSMDGGENWENMSGSLPNTPINAIILDDASEYSVYIGTDIGIFYLDADLNDWVHFSNGMPIVEVVDLEINYAENKILAGTHGRGIWWGDLYSTCEDVIVVTPVMQDLNLSHFFQASDSVISNVPVDNSFGIQVQYRSGNVVQLTEGFRATAQYGSLFRALNGECGDGGVPAVPLVVPQDTQPAIQTENQSMVRRKD